MKKRDVILNTQAHRPAFDQFAELLGDVERDEGWRPFEALGYWMEAAFRSTRAPVISGAAHEENEREYMRIVGRRCRKPQETMTALSGMLACLAEALEAEPIDFIGPVFTSLAADGYMGQFFTPHEVSKMMAAMTINAQPDPEKPVVFCCEPACGVGGMVLAANAVFRERGFNLQRGVHWTAVDIDARAVHGAYLQLNLTGCSAVVYCGDSIGAGPFSGTPTLAAAMFPKRHPEPAQIDAPTSIPDAAPSVPEVPPPAPAQLDLFGGAP